MARRIAFLVAVVALLLTLLTVPVIAQESLLTFGISNNVDTLDPNVTTFSSVGVIMGHVFSPLVYQEPLGTFHPGLATEWTINEDATEYVFTLRDDVVFHDGTPFNAEAVKFTFDRVANPDTRSQLAVSLLGPYAETEVVDEFTVAVRFSAPYAPFLNSISTPYLAPSSPSAIEAAGADYGITTVVGAGPFKLESYIPNSEVVVVRNDDFNWGSEAVFGMTGPANAERIRFTIILEPATRLAALESGEVDFIDNVPTLDVPRLMDDPNVEIVQIEQPGHGYSLMMNFEKAPTDELAVRQAISYAFDKQGIIDVVFNGFGTPGCSALTKVMFGYDPASCGYLPYDLEMAASILDEAGWVLNEATGVRERDGQPLEIQHWFRSDSPLNVAIATFIEANLAQVGIDVVLNGAAQAGYFDAVRAGQHNTQGWWDTWTDPDGMRVLFDSSRADGGTNRNRYRSEEMDRILNAAAATADSDERVALYAEAQKLAADDAIMVYYNDPYLLFGHTPALSGVVFLGGGNLPNFYAASKG
ncbi:MAG: ABC transporter substrate-binding protein [Chloroflexi bacterium]|nr:ABC transporter substrate-binding protein [Chloroflexota bacterium]